MISSNKIKEQFIKILKSSKRDGVDNLIEWLEKTDFFTAPAGVIGDNSCRFGLLTHSLNVYNSFVYDYEILKQQEGYRIPNIKKDSIIICCLLHDIAKINTFYEDKTSKNEVKYIIKDKVIMDENSKTIHYIESFIKLSDIEAQALVTFRKDNISFKTNIFAFLLNRAHTLSENFLENQLYIIKEKGAEDGTEQREDEF